MAKLRFISSVALMLTSLLLITLGATAARAQTFPTTPLKVVQLGDSYSAGNGARDADGKRNYSGVKGCNRSPTNWGSQFVDTLREVFAVTYINRACSGGVTADVLNSRVVETSQTLVGCPTATFPEEESWVLVNDGLRNTCERRLRPQIDAIDTSVDVVMLTFGGNDARFADIVEKCFVRGFRSVADCRTAVEFADSQIPLIESRVYDIFKALSQRMRKDARVVFVTYPYLIADLQYSISSIAEGSYGAGDAIRAVGEAGDTAQRAAAERVNAELGYPFVTVVDGVKEAFTGHEPAPPDVPTTNPWLHEAYDTRKSDEWYHYNPTGHMTVADTVTGVDLSGAGGIGDMATDLDVAFVVDTTGSMGGAIAQVQTELSALVNQLATTTSSYRVGVVSYRDFPERTGSSIDYPSRVDLGFSSSLPDIQGAIDKLQANGGGDWPESVFSGIATALDLSWRPGVSKIALVVGDAPALSPEPISGLTASEIVRRSIAIDPVQVVGVNVGALDDNGALTTIANGTNGLVINGTGALAPTLSALLLDAAQRPYAWLGVSYTAAIGAPVTFDASGSYDPSGAPLSSYEWDLDADGVVDATTTEPVATFVYPAAFTGHATVKVTGPGGSALGSAHVLINDTGSAPMGDEVSCELDAQGHSIIVDDQGRALPCSADALPTADIPGVSVSYGIPLVAALDDLDAAVAGLRPPAFQNKAREIRDAATAGYNASACTSLVGMAALANAQAGKKITSAQALSVVAAAAELERILGCN